MVEETQRVFSSGDTYCTALTNRERNDIDFESNHCQHSAVFPDKGRERVYFRSGQPKICNFSLSPIFPAIKWFLHAAHFITNLPLNSCFSRTETLVKNATYKFRWGENSMQTTIDDRKLDTKVKQIVSPKTCGGKNFFLSN